MIVWMHENFQGFVGTPRNVTSGAAKFRHGYQCHQLRKSNRLRRRQIKARTRKASKDNKDVPTTSTNRATAWHRRCPAEAASPATKTNKATKVGA